MSGRQAAAARATVRRPPPQEIDEEDIDPDEEEVGETQARAVRANKRGRPKGRQIAPGITERVSVKNNMGRGARAVRSDSGREANSRGASTRSGHDFTEAEIRDFMEGEDQQLPYIPDTKEHHYHWMRCLLKNEVDGGNIVSKLNGKMKYEVVVGPDMLPPKLDLRSLSIKSGDFQGGYQYRDSILVRCPQRLYKLKIIAGQRRAEQLNEMLDAGAQAGAIPGERRTSIEVEENRERYGVREVDPSEDEEAN